MSDIYLQITETPTVVTLSAPVVASVMVNTVTVAKTVTVALDANSLSALENVTVTVGAAITGTVTVGNSVTISSLPAISGTVTANALGVSNLPLQVAESEIGFDGGRRLGVSIIDSTGSEYSNAAPFPVYFTNSIPAGAARIGVVTIGAGTVTIGAGPEQIGSVTASISGTVPISISSVTIGSLPAISGTVTANLAISSTAITSGSFASLTSATLVPGNTARKMATVFNQGAGQLFVNAGATATTLGGGFMVALSSGDFYECDYTTTTLSAIFATAGTASWVSH